MHSEMFIFISVQGIYQVEMKWTSGNIDVFFRAIDVCFFSAEALYETKQIQKHCRDQDACVALYES